MDRVPMKFRMVACAMFLSLCAAPPLSEEVWTDTVPGSQPLIYPPDADLNWWEVVTADPIYVYESAYFSENCGNWTARKPPWLDPAVEEVTMVIPRSTDQKSGRKKHRYLGLPLRTKSGWTKDEKLKSFATYAQLAHPWAKEGFGSGAKFDISDPDLDKLRSYGELAIDRKWTLTEVCGALDALFNVGGVKIATGRKVPFWEWDMILMPLDEDVMTSMQ